MKGVMKGKQGKGSPEFKSLEEEREYWEARGPLAEGHKGRVNKPKAKRSSFLVIRLTGEELTQLRDIAARQGLGPSTLARMVLTVLIERESKVPKSITLDALRKATGGHSQLDFRQLEFEEVLTLVTRLHMELAEKDKLAEETRRLQNRITALEHELKYHHEQIEQFRNRKLLGTDAQKVVTP